jgi:hypothetical protein
MHTNKNTSGKGHTEDQEEGEMILKSMSRSRLRGCE